MNPVEKYDIKKRLGEYLRAKGVEPDGSGKIPCPWHHEEHPSCQVNSDYLYCHACGESGDIYEVAAALVGVPCDKGHFREIAADVERALGIPRWEPPKARKRDRAKLTASAIYRGELLKEFAEAIDRGDEAWAFFRATLLLGLSMLEEGV